MLGSESARMCSTLDAAPEMPSLGSALMSPWEEEVLIWHQKTSRMEMRVDSLTPALSPQELKDGNKS